ncbi:MAG TPA: hypothetical protein VJ617_12915 [Arthrobacter sp.]|nr:hypothetical protein [Arthrobacter sp.]
MTINSPESLPDDDAQEASGIAEPETKEHDGGIPAGNEGVGLGATGEPNTFEPEEAPETD